MIREKVGKYYKRIKVKLEKHGILQPKIEIEIPKELVEIAQKANPGWEMIAKSKWVCGFCRRYMPPELRNLTEEELKEKHPDVYEFLTRCQENVARSIWERYMS